MLIGAMNHPKEDVVQEIARFAELGLDFVDLTLEPPAAAAWRVDPQAIRRALDQHHFEVVGHTSYYLPLASPFDEIRAAAVREVRRCLEVFAAVGARWINVHPDRYTPMHDRAFFLERNQQSLEELLDDAARLGVGLMLENVPGDFNNVEQLGDLLDPLPELGLHLDIGHANLLVPTNTTRALLKAYGDRLKHVHLHDNRGGHADLHLSLGSGTLAVAECVHALKASGYDGTITLEVFSPDIHYLAYSRAILRELWDGK